MSYRNDSSADAVVVIAFVIVLMLFIGAAMFGLGTGVEAMH